jgi:hypothetical protein
MRKDLVYFYQADTASVYQAYTEAIRKVFNKTDFMSQPYSVLQFMLNYSFKYNMNGGSCTLHFLPYQGGTAVNARYSIAQLIGARYAKHEKDMRSFVEKTLGISAQQIDLDIDVFLQQETNVNQMAQSQQEVMQQGVKAPVAQQAPSQANGQPQRWFCPQCGRPNDSNFCVGCGTRRPTNI